MQWIREKFGAVIVSVIVGLLSLVFIFYGFFSPRGYSGGGGNAGTVNGQPISLADYDRALNQRMDFFRKMGGGKLTDEQLRAFHVQESVFRELAQRKLLIQEAHREGLEASDDEVKQAILDIPAFKKDGKFDLIAYKRMIESSPYGSTGNFERTVRDDLSAQHWADYFRRRVEVSDEEAKQDYILSNEKRNMKYVLLTMQNGAKGLDIKPDEIKKYLADPANMNLVKSQYEGKKNTEYKGKTLQAVQDSIARDMIASSKFSEIQKVNDQLAKQVQSMLTASKASDAKVNALLKRYGVAVKTTGLFNRQSPYIPGIGESVDLVKDAFASKSPIDASQGGHAKTYQAGGSTVVALVTQVEHPDLSKFASEREKIVRQISMKKEQQMYNTWLQGLMEKAKIQMNPGLIHSGDSSRG